MGLDITVYRVKNEEKTKARKWDDYMHKTEKTPSWVPIFKKQIQYYDWDKFKEERGIDIDEYEFLNSEFSDKGDFLRVYPKSVTLPEWDGKEDYKVFKARRDPLILEIDLNEVPLIPKYDDIFYVEEIGYQRGGLNRKFYEDSDNGDFESYIWEMKDLQYCKEHYCNTEEDKNNFQKNIIDNFTEGECLVSFSW